MLTGPVESSQNVLAELLIRPVRDDEMPSVMAIEVEAFPLDTYPVELMREYLQANPGSFLVAEDKGEVVGYIIGSPDGTRARIESMAVSLRWRRKGIGQAMLNRVLQQFKEAGSEEVELQVRVNNIPAISLYEAAGFSSERLVPDYYEPGSSANVMTMQLQPQEK